MDTKWGIVQRDYRLPIKRKTVRTEDGPKLAFEATVKPGKKLKLPGSGVHKDHKYRIHLNTFAKETPVFGQPTRVGFRLVQVQDEALKAAKVKEDRSSDPKSFIK